MKIKTSTIPTYLNTFQRAHQVPVPIGGKNRASIFCFNVFFHETHQISYNLSEELLDVKLFAKSASKDGALLLLAKVLQVTIHHKSIKKNNMDLFNNFICLCFSIIKNDN
jgi:hypothetical protein